MHGDHTQVCGRVRRTRAEAEGEGGVRATCGMGGSTLNGNVCTHAARGRAAGCGTHHALRRTDVFGLVSLVVASVAQELHRGVSNREYRFVYAEDLSLLTSLTFFGAKCENTALFVVDDRKTSKHAIERWRAKCRCATGRERGPVTVTGSLRALRSERLSVD